MGIDMKNIPNRLNFTTTVSEIQNFKNWFTPPSKPNYPRKPSLLMYDKSQISDYTPLKLKYSWNL